MGVKAKTHHQTVGSDGCKFWILFPHKLFESTDTGVFPDIDRKCADGGFSANLDGHENLPHVDLFENPNSYEKILANCSLLRMFNSVLSMGMVPLNIILLVCVEHAVVVEAKRI